MSTALKGRAMTEGAPWKHILRFSMPVLAGSLLQQLYNTADTIIVGNFSSETALSAVGTTGTITFLFLAIAMGFSAGNGVAVAQFFGAKDEKGVRSNASTGIAFLMLLGVLAAIVGIVAARPILTALVAVPESILPLSLVYFRIYAVGLIFQFGYNIFSSILRAVGDSKATLYFLLISSVINVVLDIVFVALFRWGVAGAAIATVISQAASFVAAYIYMRVKYPIFSFAMREYKLNGANVLRTVKLGLPISIQMMIVSFGLTFIQRAVNEWGPVMTASFTVGTRIEMYVNLPCNALQTTMATYTGQNVGAGKMDRITKGVKQVMVISVLFTLVISLIIWFGAGTISRLFGLSPEATVYCLQHLKAVAFVNMLLCLYVPLFGVYQGTGHPIIPAIVATAALSTRVITTYLFRYGDLFSYRIFWLNGMFGFGAGCIVAWIIYFSKTWMKIK